MPKRFAEIHHDIYSPKKVDNRSAEDIIEDITERAGIKIIRKGE